MYFPRLCFDFHSAFQKVWKPRKINSVWPNIPQSVLRNTCTVQCYLVYVTCMIQGVYADAKLLKIGVDVKRFQKQDHQFKNRVVLFLYVGKG